MSPNSKVNESLQAQEEEEGQEYRPQSPYYLLEHPLEFYGDE